MQEYLRVDLDDLISEYIYSDYDISGAGHHQVIKVEDKEKFLDDMAARFRKRVEEALYQYEIEDE